MNPPHGKPVFVVVIGDIVRSRRLGRPERARAQAQLKRVLLRINRDYKKSICTPLQFTGGDELQGVFRTAVLVFEVINRIREAIFPVPVRFGIGIGDITTPLARRPQEMDGPAFHRARDALKSAKEFLGHTCLSSGEPGRDEMVNAWLDALGFIRSGWSARAREVIRLHEELHALEPIAKKLGISMQAVSKHLRVTGYKAYVRGEKVMLGLLAAYETIQPLVVDTMKSP